MGFTVRADDDSVAACLTSEQLYSHHHVETSDWRIIHIRPNQITLAMNKATSTAYLP